MQTFATILIVAFAVGFLLYLAVRALTQKGAAGCSGCHSCSHNQASQGKRVYRVEMPSQKPDQMV